MDDFVRADPARDRDCCYFYDCAGGTIAGMGVGEMKWEKKRLRDASSFYLCRRWLSFSIFKVMLN